jgi:hypothetical protein
MRMVIALGCMVLAIMANALQDPLALDLMDAAVLVFVTIAVTVTLWPRGGCDDC